MTRYIRENTLCIMPQSFQRERSALRLIEAFVLERGRTPSVREVARQLGYKSPRSAAVLIDRLISRGFLRRRADKSLQLLRRPDASASSAETVRVPVVGSAPCGLPVLAEENIDAYVPVSRSFLEQRYRYFFLRAVGDSMDQAGISDGDLVLVRQQPVANNGETVVALVDGEATIKIFHSTDTAVVLQPRSTNPAHRPVLLTTEFRIQGVVVQTVSACEQELLWI